MRMVAVFAAGVAATVTAEALVAWLLVVNGALPINADATPPKLERWVARTALIAGVERQIEHHKKNPVSGSFALLRGIRIYRANCQICHGGPTASPEAAVARGLYQAPPQFAKDGMEDVPYGYTAWVIRHGIRFTGMPAFAGTLSQNQLNDVTLFLQRMKSLTPEQRFAWSGATLRPQLSALYKAIGGFHRCIYHPQPQSPPLGYEDDTAATSDGQFIIERMYDLNRRVSEFSAIGFEPSHRRYIRLTMSKEGNPAVETAVDDVGGSWRWMISGQTVTTIRPQGGGAYTFEAPNGSSGGCTLLGDART
ncbi:MAG TPA: cytochrome c [Candidatus Baltobacteraceae bacterium]|nr:cytochrome c [Candidatus Baltobacteraceae bacterium]